MALQITADRVSIYPFAAGLHEVALAGASANVDFSLLTAGRFGLSEVTGRVFFCDLNGRLWLVTTACFQVYHQPFEETLWPADRRRPELAAERRVFSPAQAAALFS